MQFSLELEELGLKNASTKSIEELVEAAERNIESLFLAGHQVAVNFSGGKDSSVCLNLVLQCAAKLAKAGFEPKVMIANADTKMDQPEIKTHVEAELKKAAIFAKQNGFSLEGFIASPSVGNEFWVRVIGGLKLPAFPGTNQDCTEALKITPILQTRKRMAALGNQPGIPLVSIVGTRFEESQVRSARMNARSETADIPWQNKDGDWLLSPIAYWTMENVWEYMGLAMQGAIPAYSDFEEVVRIYRDAGGTSCSVVSDMVTEGVRSARPCGARTGCWACTPIGASDKSMENLIQSDERYHYLKSLNSLRGFLFATRWDMNRRQWYGRTIKKGYVCVRPDCYGPSMQRELLRYALTIDAEEELEARKSGINPRFQIISPQALLAIDFVWSLHGFQRPFEALKIWRDVSMGARYPVPEVQAFPQVPMPVPRYVHVGTEWDEGPERLNSGLRNPLMETFGGSGCMGTRELKGGKVVMDVLTDDSLSVDEESALLVLMLESDRLIDQYWADERLSPTYAAFYYLQLGTVSIADGQHSRVDQHLRRTSHKARHGLNKDVDRDFLLSKCAPNGSVPMEVKLAFNDITCRGGQPSLFEI